MSSRDSYLAQSTLRTRTAPKPEPAAKPEAVRRCERCGCKLARDTGPYRGHLLCSPCRAPIHHVAECVGAANRQRIIMLCSGMTTREVAEALGIGSTTASSTMNYAAKQLGISGPTLRAAVEWAVARGLLSREDSSPTVATSGGAGEILRAKQAVTAREYQRLIEAIAATAAAVPGLGDLIIGATQCAHKHGYLQGKRESLEALGQ